MNIETVYRCFADARCRRHRIVLTREPEYSARLVVQQPAQSYVLSAEPEPIVEFHDRGLLLEGTVTINPYGAAVLNSKSMFIADIDDNPLFGLWSGERPSADCDDTATLSGYSSGIIEERVVKSVEELAAKTGTDWALYRTGAGFRAICASQPLQFGRDDATIALWLAALNSDPRYVRLCFEQRCFRARLTPKPWREEQTAVYYALLTPRVLHSQIGVDFKFHREVASETAFGNWGRRQQKAVALA